MFTLQAGTIAGELIGAGMPPEWAQILGSRLGKCTQELRHNGPISLEYQMPDDASPQHAALSIATGQPGSEATALLVREGNAVFDGRIITGANSRNGFSAVNIPFVNRSGETVPAFAVMRATGVEERRDRVRLAIAKPGTSLSTLYFVNGPKPIRNGRPGFCSGTGFGTALYDPAGSPTFGQEWGPVPGQWYLGANRPGFDIIGAISRGRVAVDQHRVTTLIGILGAELAQGGTATCTVYIGAAGSEASYTLSVTAADWLLGAGQSLAADTEVTLVRCNGNWYVFEAECQ